MDTKTDAFVALPPGDIRPPCKLIGRTHHVTEKVTQVSRDDFVLCCFCFKLNRPAVHPSRSSSDGSKLKFDFHIALVCVWSSACFHDQQHSKLYDHVDWKCRPCKLCSPALLGAEVFILVRWAVFITVCRHLQLRAMQLLLSSLQNVSGPLPSSLSHWWSGLWL